MGQLKDTFFGESSNETAMNDTKWMLGVIACNVLMFGLLKSMSAWQTGLIPIAVAVLFIILTFIPLYPLRLLAFAGFTLLLWLDFFLRYNPFSIAYSLIGVYHVYLLLRWKPEAKKEQAAS